MSRPALASILAPVLVAGGALFLTACGGGTDGPAATVPTDADLVVKAVGSIGWDADSYEVTTTGGTALIALVNESSLPHNLYIIDADKKANSTSLETPTKGDIDSGEFTLSPGEYSLICRVAGHGAMNSTLVVK